MLADQLQSGDFSQIKTASQRIFKEEINNPELFDIAAKALLQNYASAIKLQIDTVAWLINAIGSTGLARSRQALQEVDDNSSLRTLRKYAANTKTNWMTTILSNINKVCSISRYINTALKMCS